MVKSSLRSQAGELSTGSKAAKVRSGPKSWSQRKEGPGYIKPCLERAMEETGLSDPSGWGTAEERKLTDAYLKIRETYGRYPMTHARERAAVIKKYLDNGTISDERGSFAYNS